MVVAGIVGRKIPHYSVFGETVELAGLMEQTGEPMKIQVTFDELVNKFDPIMIIFSAPFFDSEDRSQSPPRSYWTGMAPSTTLPAPLTVAKSCPKSWTAGPPTG